jgi:hypothetical protein
MTTKNVTNNLTNFWVMTLGQCLEKIRAAGLTNFDAFLTLLGRSFLV